MNNFLNPYTDKHSIALHIKIIDKLTLLKINNYLFIVIIIIASLLNLWLYSSLRIKVESIQDYDDALYVRLAYYIINGEWLGNYDQFTLIKYPFYPLWLAFNYMTGLPLIITQSVLKIFSGVFLIYQLNKLRVNNIFLSLIFIIYIFNPFNETRVMREGIYSALLVFIFGCLIGIYRNLLLNKTILIYWSMLLGIFLSMFWLTREESIWILPSIIFIFFNYTANLYGNFKFSKEFYSRSFIMWIPFFTLLFFLNIVALINYQYYGVYRICEQNSKPFTSAMGSLLRIKHSYWTPHLLVPKHVRENIYSVSSTFRELKPYIDGNEGNAEQREIWKQGTCKMFPTTCSDYGGAWFIWAIRLAVADAGYYTSAAVADRYYQRLTKEIDSACKSNILDCFQKNDAIIPPYRKEYTSWLAKTYIAGFRYILSVPVRDYVYNPFALSIADRPGLLMFQKITHNRVLPIMTTSDYTFVNLKNYDLINIKALKYILRIYKYIFPFIVYFSLTVYAFNILLTLISHKPSFLFIFGSSIFIAIAFRLAILSFIDITLFPAFTLWPSYINPFYPLFIIFAGIILYDIFNKIFSYIHENK